MHRQGAPFLLGDKDMAEQDEVNIFKPEELTQGERKDFLKKVAKRNKYNLIDLSDEEKKRVAEEIIRKYNDMKGNHQNLCDKIDEWDEVSRLIRKPVIGDDGSLPNYRMPISLVAHEVIHANIMNVFFSPKDILRVIPTAADDVQKVNNISVFGNWSMKNELDMFNKIDQLFHASEKNGEGVAMIYWKKEYGVELKRVPVHDELDGQIQYDPITQEPICKIVEVPKLVYDAPYMEVISRKDYLQPDNAVMGEAPEWEGRFVRLSYDQYLRDELEGKYYSGSIDKITSWPTNEQFQNQKQDYDGEDLKIGKWNKEFIEWYGRFRIMVVEEGKDEMEQVKAHELEDEFEALVHIQTQTLCFIKKNRRPMKLRPFVTDYFIPDDTGRRAALGVYEVMDSMQKCYDTLYNHFVYAVELSNSPIFFFTPFGNMRDEKIRVQRGYMYPTSDPNSVKMFNFSGPDEALKYALQLVQQWAQFLFGISAYSAGMESQIDPSAPAKKAEIIVEQGNVRLNMIIKRKNDTLKEIFKRWFLLYQANMPPNKFMRIAGEGENKDPFKFNPITYEDFALQSLPDFELTGNILNANKQLEANKAIAIYQMLIQNVFFNPQTMQGLQALRSLTKWLIDKLDDAGLSRFLPEVQNEGILYTPEEENAVMLQGQEVIPLQNEDHMQHLKAHLAYLNDPNTPEQIKPIVGKHIKQTIEMIRQGMTSQMVMQSAGGFGPQPQGPSMLPNVGGPAQPMNTQGGVNGLNMAGVGGPGQPGNIFQ